MWFSPLGSNERTKASRALEEQAQVATMSLLTNMTLTNVTNMTGEDLKNTRHLCDKITKIVAAQANYEQQQKITTKMMCQRDASPDDEKVAEKFAEAQLMEKRMLDGVAHASNALMFAWIVKCCSRE